MIWILLFIAVVAVVIGGLLGKAVLPASRNDKHDEWLR
jgi:hypothetical protein